MQFNEDQKMDPIFESESVDLHKYMVSKQKIHWTDVVDSACIRARYYHPLYDSITYRRVLGDSGTHNTSQETGKIGIAVPFLAVIVYLPPDLLSSNLRISCRSTYEVHVFI